MVKPLRQGEANIMATLGRKALGPFGSAREAYEAAEEVELKLGMTVTVEELEVFMTRERKICKGPRKNAIPHFCLYKATISSTASADITSTVACAARVLSRPPIAVQRGTVEATAAPAPVAVREQGSTLAALWRQTGTWNGRRRLGRVVSRDAQRIVKRYRIVRHVHLFWGLQHYPERALCGEPGARRGPPAAPGPRRATART
jgi:hypothetical protein